MSLYADDFILNIDEQNREAIPFIAITPQGKLNIFSTGDQAVPEEDWRVLSLINTEVQFSAQNKEE